MGKRGMKRPAAASASEVSRRPAAACASEGAPGPAPPEPALSQGGPVEPGTPSLPGSSQDSPTPPPVAAPRRFWPWLFPNSSDLETLDNIVCMMEEPSLNYPNQFFCLERKRLLHLSIDPELLSNIPKWKWSDSMHTILTCLVEPGDPVVDAHIIWLAPFVENISHESFLQASRSWALQRHLSHMRPAVPLEDGPGNQGLSRFEDNEDR